MYKVILTYIFIFSSFFVFSQETVNLSVGEIEQQQDSVGSDISIVDSIIRLDTMKMVVDSVTRPVIEAPIDYTADDSIIFSLDGQKVFLYNNAKITYQEIELTAYFIELDLETKEVYAEGVLDSTETLIQNPVFKDSQEEFEAKTLRYNFQTGKGIITNVVTEQGEGYFHSERTKKVSENTFLATGGKYTTCDAVDPHFYLHISKAKVISNDKIIVGPSYLVLEDVPIYFLFLPFGYFPSSPTYSSGILVPNYGEEINRGFFLRDGGYYWAASEYFDLAVQGDIYSKGSWAAKLHTNYRKRYKFNGSFDFRYNVNIYGEKGLNTYSRSPQFAVTWSHSQDAKANPNQTFSASVNFSTTGYDRQNALSAENYLRTQKSSSVSYSKKFENTPFNVSINLRHSQNSADSTITLSLPEMTFSMARIYPFRSKNRVGSVKWYENFSINYTGNFRNSITAKESDILRTSFALDWKNGIKHNIPISFPGFTLFNHFRFSPGIGYDEKWYFKKYNYSYHENQIFYDARGQETHIKTDTITGLNRVYSYSYSLSATTDIYGNYTPLNKNSKIEGIRHKMTPSVGFSYSPDFGDSKFGYWQAVQIDSTGKIGYFDVNQGGIYGGSPGRGASGSISFSLDNNIEMKVRDDRDTTRTDSEEDIKKVKILDIGFSGNYNLVADSLNLSTININGRTTIAGVNLNMGAILDPYMINENGTRINKFVWNEKTGLARIGRLTRANLSFGMNFSSKRGQQQANQNRELIEDANLLPGNYANYTDFNVPWNLSFNYSFNYIGPTRLGDKGKITQTIGVRGNLTLTSKWNLSMNTNFDIMAGQFSFTNFNVARDLHCWSMSFDFVPFGYRKSYSFRISARSSILRDLKLTKNKSYYDNF